MTKPGAWICAVGLLTPVGGCAAQTAASVRAGISGFRAGPVHNKRFEPMTLALVPDDALPPLAEPLESAGLTARQARMLRLAGPALAEALEALPPDSPKPPLLLALPEAAPGRPAPAGEDFLAHLALQSEAAFDSDASQVYPSGRSGGFQAMAAAIALLAEGGHDFFLVGGLDSHLDLYLLGTLDQDNRVLAEGIMDGFAPGEGAAFLLLAGEAGKARLGAQKTPHLSPPGLAEEPGHRGSSEPYKGDGLANAVRQALAQTDGTPVRSVLAGLNGESFGAKEWGVAALRNHPAIDPESRFEHPADCFGDTGAAVGPLLVGLAALGLRSGNLPGPCLAWGSSEGAPRAAVCVTLN